jgi:hypothetical protein
VRIFDLCTNFSRLHAYTSFQLGGCQDSQRTPARGGHWGTHRYRLPPSSTKKNTHRKRKRNFDPFSQLHTTHEHVKGWSTTRSPRFTSCSTAQRHRLHMSTSRGGAPRDFRDSHRAQLLNDIDFT